MTGTPPREDSPARPSATGMPPAPGAARGAPPRASRRGLTLRTRIAPAGLLAACALAGLAACGGGDGNPFGNPPLVTNGRTASGQSLSFEYFQHCVYPVLVARLPITQNGVTSVNQCSSSGCHDIVNGTGAALAVVNGAGTIDTTAPGFDAGAARASDMYRSFYSAQAAAVIGAPQDSRLLNKPLVRNGFHGGGLVFNGAADPNARILAYWITQAMPQGQDEFGAAGTALFSAQPPSSANCLTS